MRRQAPRKEHGFPPELAEITSQPGVLEWEWRIKGRWAASAQLAP